jgi:iron complex outermembrane receptor protein
MSKTRTVIGAAALLVSASALPFTAPALAQEASASDGAVRDTITVTARRREESLKDVPVAVSALSGDFLDEIGAPDITSLQALTPNATVQVARGSNSTLISFIRGVGQQDPLWGFEPGVGLYVDDVYIARPQGAVLDIFDIERIEVLRGPQGTLYGRNTIGGAIKYVTRRMGEEPTLMGRVSAGSYNQLDYMASGSAPLSDTFAVGAAFARYTRDGYGDNLTTGQDHYNKDVTAYRLSAEWTPTDSLFFRAAYDRVDDNSNPRHGSRLVAGVAPGSQPLDDIYDTNAGLTGENEVQTEGYSLTAEWALNDTFTFKSITAYRDGRSDTVIDFDNTPSNTLDIPAYYADDQFTQEFQLAYSGERLQGVVGVYYLDGSAEGAFDTIAGVLSLAIGTGGDVQTESYALFGDFSFDLTERLRLSVGARYTEDEKTGTVFRANYLGTDRTPLTGGAPATPILVRTDYTNTRTFDQFTPRISLSYDLTDQLTGYVSYSQGFKSGGFDMRGDAIFTPDTVNGYEPETVDSYEIGLKGEGLGGMLNFSSALFWSDYQDQQVTTQVPSTTGIASFVDNVGQSTIYGAEVEGTLFLSENLTANFAVGLLQAEYDEFIRFDLTTSQFVDISDQVVFQNAPEFTGYLGLTYQTEALGGDLAITPSIAYRGEYSQFEFPNALLDEDGYTLVDLSAVWNAPNGNWQVAVHGRNLTDEEYRIGGYNFPGALFDDSVVAFYGPPRTFTASVTYRY